IGNDVGSTRAVGQAGTRRRYIVCRNRQKVETDAADRASIVAALERQLAKGVSALSQDDRRGALRDRSRKDRGGEEVRRHLRAAYQHRSQSTGGYALLQAAVDGGADLSNSKASVLHPADLPQARRDHPRSRVFCSFFALVLKSELEERTAGLGRSGSWPQIIADLDSLTETEIEYDGKRFIVRSAPRPAASLALQATGVACRRPSATPQPPDPP